MLSSVILFAIIYAVIISEKIERTVVVFSGVFLMLALGFIPYDKALHTIDMNVLCLLTGMMIVVHILAETGVFEWFAIQTAQVARGNGLLIFLGLLNVTGVVSAFLDNVTTLVLIAPITLLICQLLELDPVLFLIYEAIFSNLGGTATLVGDPPNVLIGSQGHIPFMAFIDHLTPVVLICMTVISLALIPIFKSRLRVSPRARAILRKADPAKAIVNPRLLKQALPVFLLILVGFFAGHTFHLEPGYVAIVGAVLMLLVTRQPIKPALDAVQWETLAFFTGLFILIGTLAEQGVFEWAAKEVFSLSRGNLLAATMLILWFCGFFSAVVDNIPVVLAMIPLIHAIIPEFASTMGIDAQSPLLTTKVADPLWWSLALGACLGGNGTLFGAAANIVAAQIAKKNNYPISFNRFTSYGFPTMVASLAICSGYIYVRYFVLQ
mgnify:CR=1 FL=1